MPFDNEVLEDQSISKAEMMRKIGYPGTETYSGYFFEDPNTAFRDESRIDIIEEMRRTDGAVKAALMAVKAPMLATEWYIDAKDEKIKDFIHDALFNMKGRSWKDFLREALAYLDFGFYPFEMIFERRDGMITLQDLEPRIPHSVQKWKLDDGRDGIVQLIRSDEADIWKTTTVQIPMEKILLFTNEKEGDDVTGQPIIRAAYKHYKIKDTLYRVQGISAERYGVGVPVVTLPENFSDTNKAEAEEMVKNLRSNEKSYIVLPSPEWELSILVPQGNPQSAQIKDAIDHHNRQILLSVLASFLSLGGESSGSFALSRDQSSFFLNNVEDKATYVAERITEIVIKKLVHLNFGSEAEIPRLRFTPLGQVNITDMSSALKNLADADLIDKGHDTKKFVHDMFKLPELEDEPTIDTKPENDSTVDVSVDDAPEEAEPVEEEMQDKKCYQELNEVPFVPFRALTEYEDEAQFKTINDEFNKNQTETEDTLSAVTSAAIFAFLMRAKSIMNSGDISGIADLSLKLDTPVRKTVDNLIRNSYEAGKVGASIALGTEAPATSKQQNQLRRLEASEIADQFQTNLDNSAKATIRNALVAGATTVAIIPALRDKLVKEASNMIVNISGTIVGQNINRGRKQVFDDNIVRIAKYLRSEVLDGRTCNVCLSLDKRVVTADDPTANMDLVHTHCRGVWVPILTDDTQPDLNPIPKTVISGFDMIDGRPVINAFKQLKKPINKSNEGVQEAIKSKLEK